MSYWIFRKGPHGQRSIYLVEFPLLMVMLVIGFLAAVIIPNYLSRSHRLQNESAISDTKTAVTQAIVFANDKGVYPASLKAMRNSGYANVPDTDPWKSAYVLSSVFTRSGTPQQKDDVYVYSKGRCGTGTYEPTRWRKDPRGYLDTGQCGAVGYSSLLGTFAGDIP